MGFGWRAVDLVSQQQFSKNRTFGQAKIVGLEIKEIGAQNVARHEIRRELNAAEIESKTGSKAPRKQRFRRTRNAF